MEPPQHLLELREIAVTDALVAAALSAELGYPVSPETMARRIQDLRHAPNHTVYVACESQNVIAWIDVSLGHHLQSEPYCEIGGLVVASAFRGSGIGRALVDKAEGWARERGVSNMLVRSRITREAAHRFYLRAGYTQTKTSAVFSKQLVSPDRSNPA